MPQYAYAVVIVDGKRKVIKTKGFSDANPLLANGRVMLAKSELEKDLKAAGIKYTYIGISEHPPTSAELEKVSKAATKTIAKNPVSKSKPSSTEGTWYFYKDYCLNFVPKYRFAKVIEKIGTPYYDDNLKCQKVMVELYGYKRVGTSCVPYVSDTDYYMPTEKIKSKKGELIYYHDTTRLKLGAFEYLEQWDGKKAGEVVCRYSPYD